MPDTLSLDVSGMTCGHCVAAVNRALREVAEVGSADVRIGGATITLAPTADPATAAAAAVAAIREAGYEATVSGDATPAR